MIFNLLLLLMYRHFCKLAADPVFVEKQRLLVVLQLEELHTLALMCPSRKVKRRYVGYLHQVFRRVRTEREVHRLREAQLAAVRVRLQMHSFQVFRGAEFGDLGRALEGLGHLDNKAPKYTPVFDFQEEFRHRAQDFEDMLQ